MFSKKFLAAAAWAMLILVLCGIPGKKIPELTFLQWLKPDKVVHLLLFGIQCYLLLRAFRSDGVPEPLRRRAVPASLFLAIGYGALVEWLQVTVFIDRSGDVRDAAANAAGAALGAWIFLWRQRRATAHRDPS
jgi:VanZ family protein